MESGKATSQELFDTTVTAFNAKDKTAANNAICRSVWTPDALGGMPDTAVKLTSPAQDKGDTSTAHWVNTYNGGNTTGVFNAKREAGLWCLLGIVKDKK